jgi:hypothetical protein
MKLLLAIVFSVSIALAGQGSDKPQFKKAKIGASVDLKAPVTKSEAAAVFVRARKAIAASRIAQMDAKSTIALGNAPVTREEVISEMAKIFEASKKAVKFVPAPTRHDPAVFKVGSPALKASLGKLVTWGFIAPVGPLATGPKPNLTVAQFGDAIGFFMARMTDVTHMPSPRWSPYLMPNEGG